MISLGIEGLSRNSAGPIRGIASSIRIDAVLIDSLPALEIIANYGVGYDKVDVDHTAKRNVVVTNTPGVGHDRWTAHQPVRVNGGAKSGQWGGGEYPLSRLTLRGHKVGIFRMGRIGQAVARRLAGLSLSVAYHNRRPVVDIGYEYPPRSSDWPARSPR